MALGGKREAGGVDAKRGRGELGRGGRGVKGATLVVVAGKAACGAPGGLAHGRDVAEAMGRGGGTAQAGRGVVLGVAWPSGIAGHLCRRPLPQHRIGEGEGEGEERRKREKGERRADRWAPLPCGVHVSKTTLKTTRMAKCD